MANVFKIPDGLSAKYKGSGIAIAATSDAGELLDLVYLSDLLPDFSGRLEDAEGAIDNPKIAPAIRYLQSLGSVHVGMCSCWEFVEL